MLAYGQNVAFVQKILRIGQKWLFSMNMWETDADENSYDSKNESQTPVSSFTGVLECFRQKLTPKIFFWP